MNNNDEKLKSISQKVLRLANIPEEENFGSVIAVLMVISIILTLIRVLQECNKTKLSVDCSTNDKYQLYGDEIKSYSIKRGWYTKLRIKKILRKKMSQEQYARYSLALIGALMDVGENLKDEEVITLVEAANV